MPRKSKGPYLAWVEKRGLWYVRVNENGGRRELSTGTSDRSEAEAALGEYLAQRRARSRVGPPPADNVLIADCLADYLEERGHEQAQPKAVASRTEKLLRFWGRDTVAAVSTRRCADYGRWSAVQDSTLRRELGTLRAALNYAVQEGRLDRAPFVRLPEAPAGRDRWLTRQEAARLLWECRKTRSDTRPYLTLFVRLALYCGARPGAVMGLRWPQIKWAEGEGGVIDFNAPGAKKTNKRRARVPMTPRIVSMLQRAKRTHGSDLGAVINRRGAAVADIGSSFAAACERAGLDDVKPHTLRHTRGTWLAQEGVDFFQISGWLGQTVSRTTELYAHHHPDHMKRAREAAG